MRKRLCPGPLDRRTFLRAGVLALGGLTLSDLLAARAAASPDPLARVPHTDTSVILF